MQIRRTVAWRAYLTLGCLGMIGIGCGAGDACRAIDQFVCQNGGVYVFDTCGNSSLLEPCDCGCAADMTQCSVCPCVPECTGRQCGDDGCGGSCGTCGKLEMCAEHTCVVDPAAGDTCAACDDNTDCKPGYTCASWAEFPSVHFCSEPCEQPGDCSHEEMDCQQQLCAPAVDTFCVGDAIHVEDSCGNQLGFWMNCEAGLYCEEGRCVDPCARCIDAACGDFSQACTASDACQTFWACNQDCTLVTCTQACVEPNFQGAREFHDLLGCAMLQCPISCYHSTWDELACNGCMYMQCTEAVLGCLGDHACALLWRCLSDCGEDTACRQGCADSYPGQIDLFNAIPSCLRANCVNECDINLCEPDCTGKACGPDGCSGSCGTCASGYTCSAGRCTSSSNRNACDECLESCRGLSSCCTGLGCICKDECASSGECPPGTSFRCGPYGDCYCLPY